MLFSVSKNASKEDIERAVAIIEAVKGTKPVKPRGNAKLRNTSMNDIYIRYVKLPITVRGITSEDENGDYNIYINSLMSSDQQQLTIEHEMKHIERNDFASDENIYVIEDLDP